MAMVAVLALSGLICGGLLAAATGHGLWLFVAALVIFLGMFVKFGCQAH